MTGFDGQAGRHLPNDPPLDGGERSANVTDMQDAVHGLAELMVTAENLDALMAEVAEFAVHAIPNVDGASLSIIDPAASASHLVVGRSWAVTAEFVGELDRLQYDVLNEGPCLTAAQIRRPQVSGALETDPRWPRFGPRAAALGVHAVLSLPLLIDGEPIGAINAYARGHDVFTEHAVQLGSQFARPAAVSVHTARLLAAVRKRAENLQSALASRAVINQAIGAIRARTGVSADAAFAWLRQVSQSENTKLYLIAEQYVENAALHHSTR